MSISTLEKYFTTGKMPQNVLTKMNQNKRKDLKDIHIICIDEIDFLY